MVSSYWQKAKESVTQMVNEGDQPNNQSPSSNSYQNQSSYGAKNNGQPAEEIFTVPSQPTKEPEPDLEDWLNEDSEQKKSKSKKKPRKKEQREESPPPKQNDGWDDFNFDEEPNQTQKTPSKKSSSRKESPRESSKKESPREPKKEPKNEPPEDNDWDNWGSTDTNQPKKQTVEKDDDWDKW